MTMELWGRNISYRVINNITFSLRQGEVVALMGPNGAGKSTLARIMAGLIEPDEGELGFVEDGIEKPCQEVKHWQQIGIIGQHPRRQTIGATVAEELGFGLLNLGYEVKKVQEMVKEIAHDMGLGDKLNQSPATLSGGERQRLVFAAILDLKPSFLILDEALSMLDERSQEACLAQLEIKGKGIGQLWITHDPQLAVKTDRLWVMSEGKLIDAGLPQDALKDEEFCNRFSIRPLHRSVFTNIISPGERTWDKYIRLQTLRQAGGNIKISSNMKEDTKISTTAGLYQATNLYLEQGTLLQWEEARYSSRLQLTEQIKGKNFLVILGPSGAGKSTLLESAIDLIKPTEGKYLAFGQEVTNENSELRQKVRLILQEPGEYFIGSTVADEVFYLQSKKERQVKVGLNFDYLEVFGIPRKRAAAYPEHLSGGERQRVALAAALESLPEVLLLDEPLLGLDAEGWTMFRGLLRELKGKLTIIYVTHDLSEVRDMADEVWLIEKGKVSFKCLGKDIDRHVERFKEAGVRC